MPIIIYRNLEPYQCSPGTQTAVLQLANVGMYRSEHKLDLLEPAAGVVYYAVV